MRRNAFETLIGALVLAVAVGFFYFAYERSTFKTTDGYLLTVKFDNVGSLSEGADVRISGIKVGSVTDQAIEDDLIFARVTLNIDNAIQLPADTAATITTDGLLGDAYIRLDPGYEEGILQPGGAIAEAHGAIDLIDLVKQAVFKSDS